MIRTNKFECKSLGKNYVLTPTKDFAKEYNGMIIINATAKFMWDCLAVEISVDELVAKCVAEYGCTEAEVRETLPQHLQTMNEQGVITGYSM